MQSYLLPTRFNIVKTAGNNRLFVPFATTVVVFLLLFTNQGFGQITGTVYRDFNADGVRSFTTATPTTGEIGVGGVTVTVYSGTAVVGSAISSTVAATQGNYSITPTSTGPFRIQFSNLPTGYFEGPHGAGSGTSVQFVASATTANVNLGINYPTDYCQTTTTPQMVLPCYENGSGVGNTFPIIVSFAYTNSGTDPGPDPDFQTQSLGAVWGVAYQRRSKQVFTSAFLKRHAGLGPRGADGVYRLDYSGATPTLGGGFDLQGVTPANGGAAIDLGTVNRTNVTTDIAAGAAGDFQLPSDRTKANVDLDAFAKIGKTSYGGIEFTEDENSLWLVNLNQRSLLRVNATNPLSLSGTLPGALVNQYYITPTTGQPSISGAPGCTNGTLRPFGLKFYRGLGYLGCVCDAASSATVKQPAQLIGYVLSFNPANPTSFSTVLTIPLNYNREPAYKNGGTDLSGVWQRWMDTWNSDINNNFFDFRSAPQPILADIEFTEDGSMNLGFIDRFSHQSGFRNYAAISGDRNLNSGVAAGDLIKATRTAAGGYVLDGGEADPGAPATNPGYPGFQTTDGAANNGEFFWGDYYLNFGNTGGEGHYEITTGGLAIYPGKGEVTSTVFDPTSFFSQGIRWFNQQSGAINRSYLIVQSGNATQQFGKGSDLGDVELLCDPAPIEIGNRIFNDGPSTTADGLQGSAGTSLSGVTVQLYKGTTLVGQTVTDANGEYYFNNSNVTGTLLPLMAYEIRVPLNQTALAGYVLTQPNAGTDETIDSDGIFNGTNAVIALTTGNYGENNHTYDIGFATCATINNPSAAQSVCSGSPVSSLSVATTSTGTNSIRFVYFTTPQSGTAMYTGGTTIGTATPTGGAATITIPTPVSNTTNAPIIYYVYAVLNPTPVISACLPSQLIQITINPIPVPTATGGAITCVAPATVTGTSSLTGSTFSWTRVGGGFTSTAASFTTNTPGSYVLTVTANGCTSASSATAVVTLDTTPPANVAAINNGPLTCAQTSVVLTASSSTTGVSYRWLAPLTATTPNTSVSTPGTYSVVITAANGCTAIATTTVLSNTVAPTATINSLTLTCTNPSGILSASVTGGTAPYTYRWSTTEGGQAIVVSAAGPYSVTVTGANGCNTVATTTVGSNTMAPTATINSLTLTCANPSGTLTANVSGGTTPYTYRWSTNATSQQITVSTAGPYSVTVTGANGCNTVATTTVGSNTVAPVSTINSLTLTCAVPTGTLTANVTGGTTPYVYQWSTNATSASIPVTTAGTYSVTVTGANGCSIVATTTVVSNTVAPVATLNSLTLTCANPSGTLTASASGGTAPYAYRWSTNVTSQQITVTTAGPYSVTVTGANGCSAVATTTVTSNTAVPVASINSLTLTCAVPTGTLTASVSGGTMPYGYQWSTNATSASIPVTTAGTYSVTVTGANGCNTVATTTVGSNTAAPVVTINSLTLTCAVPTGTLTASVTGGTTPYGYQWSTNATTQTITVTTAGTYSVTVTGANGCSIVATTTVVSNTVAPVATLNSLTLTCTNPSGTLTASASGGTAPYAYRWSTNATSPQITVTTAGPYSVTVTGANGCSAVATTTVASDTAVPTATISSLTLTCANPSGTLTASASGGVAPYTYRWSTNATTQTITVGSPGNYSVLVTGANGCSASAVTTVLSDVGQPTVSISSLTLTCTNPTGTLTASVSGGIAPFTYRWNTNATSVSIPVTTAGLYSVTVTGSNGCIGIANTNVTSDTAVPVASINSLTLTCTNPTGTLSASVTGGTTPYVYRWSTNATSASIPITTAGTYSVTVTGANGCSTVATTTVISNTAVPVATVNSLTLTCTNPTGTLTANVSGGTTPYTYRWSTNATTASIPVTTAGTYSVTVTGANGCSTVATTTVISDTAVPTATINSLTLTCTNPTGTLSASVTGGTTPYVYRWSTNATTASIPITTAGTYSVTVTGPNGCSTVATTTVILNTAVPVATLNSLTLACANPISTLTASVTGGTTPYTYRWSTNATSSTISVSTAGPYSVTVTGANGCSTVATTTVASDTAVPTATVNSLTLSCNSPSGVLTANVTGGTTPYTYRWSTNANSASIPVSTAGTYSVTVTGSNGCISIATTTVTSDMAVPTVSVNSLTLTCANPAGTLTATVAGGTTPYTYRWSTNATSASIPVTTAGTYSVTVTGANGCIGITTTTVASDTAVPTATVNSLTLTCANPTGTLTVNVTGGTTPYTYRWSTNATSASIPVTTAGTYSVTVTGANGCSTVATTTVVSDAAVPIATLNSLTLTCANPAGTLTANVSGGSAPYTYRFSTNATSQQITVNTAGTYSVTVTGANGCIGTTTTTVTSDTAVPTVTVNSLTLTCANPTGTLTASVPGGMVPYTYRWNTGATTPIISVSAAGPYSVAVTGNNGCTGIALTTVVSDTAVPTVTVNSLTLTCANPTGTLTASVPGNAASYTFGWSTGAVSQSITINAAGPYSVTVTGTNGCSTVTTSTVVSNTTAPTVSVNSLTLTCTNSSGRLSATVTGGAAPYTYQWSTGENTPAITVNQAGPYFVSVTGSNGCNTVASATVSSDAATPLVSLNSLTLSCGNPAGTLTASVTGGSAPYTYRFSTNATSQQITVNTAGTYSVTVTGANGCINVETTNVASDTAVPTVTVNSLTVTCTNPTGILSASVTGDGTYTYQWNTGATTPTISVSAAGPYSVAVTSSNGCTGIALTTVISDTAVPVAGINSLTLTCANPTGTLTANVSGGVAPYTYRWSTNATTPSISVGSAGSYSVVVTGANGCSTTATTTVGADAAQPNTNLNSLTLTCNNPTGTLVETVTSGVGPFTYRWSTGATSPSIPVSVAGPYSVTVTGSNGCFGVETTTVRSDTAVPVATINSLTLTCANPSGLLSVSVTGGAAPYAYRWSTNATSSTIAATTAGLYSVTVTGANGCNTVVTTNVGSDTAVPVVSVNSLTLTCTNPTGALSASVTGGVAPYSYRWSNTAVTSTISVSAAGTYSVTVIGANGCSGVATTPITSDTAVPTVTVNSLTLTCINPSGTLTANASGGTAPYTYQWNTGATSPAISVTAAGTYVITLIGSNGCRSSASTTVVSSQAAPVATLNSLTLTCTNSTGILSASVTGGTAPYAYLWSNSATTPTISVNAAGPYSVTVTGSNGCSTVATTTVSSNTTAPAVTVNSLTLTCANSTGILSASVTGGTAPYTYLWSNNATTPTISVNAAGPYSVTVTGANGCSTVATTTIGADAGVPLATINSLTLTCTNPTGTLTASVSGGTTPYTYLWSNSATTPTISVSAAGPYSVTVTGSNGCSAVATSTVLSDTAVPTVSVNSLTLTCASPTGSLSAIVTGGTAPFTYKWNTNATIAVISVGSAGTYSVQVTGANGCSASAITTITAEVGQPNVSLNSLTLTCANPTGTLLATVTDGVAPFTYLWSTGATTQAISVTTTALYSVTVTGSNGCIGVERTRVSSDTAVPALTINSLTLTCANPTGTLSASINGGSGPFTYLWNTGSNSSVIIVGANGPYSVTVTGSNGCSTVATTTVVSDTVAPTLTVSASSTLITVGSSVTLTASCSTGGTLTWSTGAADNNKTTLVVSPQTTTPYSVTCTSPSGCTAVSSTTVTVQATASIGSFVFEDVNGNGQQDPGETGINGVTVTLLGGPAPLSTTTVNGLYSFVGLTPGVSYTVVFSTPQGYTVTIANQGNDATDSDADPATGSTAGYVLTPGQSNTTVNAGFYRPASLGDKVFADLNRDGLQTPGETGIGGVTVTLISNGTVVATTTSQPDGTYSFTGLTPGIPYSVSFTAPANNTASPANQGADDNADSDGINGVTQSLTLSSGQNNNSVDAGFYPLRFDLSLNKSIARAPTAAMPGELIIYQLVLTNQGDITATNTQVTDYSPTGLAFNAINSPNFSLSGVNAIATVASLAPGQSVTLTIAYNVTGYSSQPIVNTAEITADSGDDFDSQPNDNDPNQDDTGAATIQTAQPASIGSFVFEDTNANGQQDPGETGINGVTVTLLGGPAPLSTTTVNGVYSFTGLTPGVSYTVVFSTPQGYTATVVNVGSDNTDSDADPVTGRTTGFTLASGEYNPTVNAGFYLIPKPCSLTITPIAGTCTNATNGTVVTSVFSSTVTVTLTNSVTGTLSITDGISSFTATVAAGTTAVTGTYSGLPSDGSNRTVTATLAGCGSASAVYQAPVPCQPVPMNPLLSVLKTVSRSSAQTGDTLTYTIILTNSGSATTTAATTVRDSLTNKVTYVAGSASVPAGTTFVAGRPVSLWTIPSIGIGQSLTLTFQVRVDSSGIVYNTATIPGSVATVCTSIPVIVCAGSQYEFRLTVAPGRSSYRWFRNGVEVTAQTTNVFVVTSPGSYSLAADNVVGSCPDFTCCPFVVVEDTLPTFAARAIAATCLGTSVRANGQLVITNVNPAYRYQYSAGATFNAAASLSGAPRPVPTNGLLVNNLANPVAASQFTIRVYNRSGCFTDQTVTLQPTVCNCPPDVCVPFVLKQTKRGH